MLYSKMSGCLWPLLLSIVVYTDVIGMLGIQMTCLSFSGILIHISIVQNKQLLVFNYFQVLCEYIADIPDDCAHLIVHTKLIHPTLIQSKFN